MDVSELVPLGKAIKRVDLSEWRVRRQLRLGELEGVFLGGVWFLTESQVKRLAAEYPLEAVTA